MTIQTIEVNGARLAYETHIATAGAPPLVFVHGYAMRATGPTYRLMLEILARTYSVYALDLRGHGGSAAASAGWSLEALADDVAAFPAALGLSGAVYVGHSLGGLTGLNAAIRNPAAFSSGFSALCLLASAAGSGGRHNPPGIGELFIAQGRDPAAMRQAFGPMYLRAAPEEIEHAVESVGLLDPAVHQAFFPSYMTFDVTGRLGEVRTPALVINGLRDVVVPPAEQHLTALALPRCKEVNLSSEGHMLPIEAPALVAREIVAFAGRDLGEVFAA